MSQIDSLLARADAEALLPILEHAELSAPASAAPRHPHAAAHLLCLLLSDDLPEARFLWRRLSPAERAEAPVRAAWGLARALWARAAPDFYAAARAWGGGHALRPLVDRLVAHEREKGVGGVRGGYSRIAVQRLGALLGVEEGEVESVCRNLGWKMEGGWVVVAGGAGKGEEPGRTELQTLTEQLVRLQTSS